MNKPASVPSFARPAFVEAARAQFEELAQRHPEIEQIDAVLVDICGTLRGKRLPIADAARLFETGMQLPKSVYLMDAKGEMVNPFGRGFGDGNAALRRNGLQRADGCHHHRDPQFLPQKSRRGVDL